MTVTTILEGLQEYLAGYTSLKANSPVWVNYLGTDPTAYSIVPQPGEAVVERYLNEGAYKVYPFAFQSMESTADELERLESSGFYEAFSDWLESEYIKDSLPTLPSKKTAVKLEATGSGYLYEEGASETGVYQIQCRLFYMQDP
jgi:hypothetical protein